MNYEQKLQARNEYKEWYAGGNFGLRLDVAAGKYSDERLIELFSKYIRTKVNDRCFGRRKWYDYSESKVVNFHGFKEGTKIRSRTLGGFFSKGEVTNNYVKTINKIAQDRNFQVTTDGEILNYETDTAFKGRYFHNHFVKDSDNINIRKQLRMKHTDTEEHFHFAVWLPNYIKYTTYKDTDYSGDYQSLVGNHLRDIITEYNAKETRMIQTGSTKNRFTLDIQIHTYNEMTNDGKYYVSKKLQIDADTTDFFDRRVII